MCQQIGNLFSINYTSQSSKTVHLINLAVFFHRVSEVTEETL